MYLLIFILMAAHSTSTLTVTSTAFEQMGEIPLKYTCEGENINPPLNIGNIPPGTKSLTLIMDDPDAPNGTFDHWIIWNIEPGKVIAENSKPGIEGNSSYGKPGYKGPCPPTGSHRYFFKVYALDSSLELKAGADKKTVEKAIQKHILAYGELIGIYKKTKQ